MALSALAIKHAKEGMLADGNGLYLRVQASGAKSWIFRYQLNGKRREMGIGRLTDKLPVVARAEASELLKQVHSGIDPIEDRKRKDAQIAESAQKAIANATTFNQVAAEYIAGHRSGWRSQKHGDQWENTLATYAGPIIGNTPVADVTIEDILSILQPIWTTKTETASRVRSRIESVLSYAKAKKLRDGENPALWRGNLDALLPKPNKVMRVKHHPALPYAQIYEFMVMLHNHTGSGARALEFAILNAARSGEVRLATWSEINLETKIWTVPAERMKMKKEHRVPLSSAAVELLKKMPRVEGNPYVFPGTRSDRPISDMTLSAVIRRDRQDDGKTPKWIDPKTGSEVVPHGFRSTFRDWAGEATQHPADMVELALSHTVGNKVEAAYRRGDMFEKRRALMEDWATFCLQER